MQAKNNPTNYRQSLGKCADIAVVFEVAIKISVSCYYKVASKEY